MSASPHLPKTAPVARTAMDSAFVERVLGKREARRLAGLVAEAEAKARQRLDAVAQEVELIVAGERARTKLADAVREVDLIMAAARAEAEAILAALPDFAAIEAAPARAGKSAFRTIRAVADRHGVAMAVVTGRQRDAQAVAIRHEAVRAVAACCPTLSHACIGALFSDISATAVARILGEKSHEQY